MLDERGRVDRGARPSAVEIPAMPPPRPVPALPADHLVARSLAGGVSRPPRDGDELIAGRAPGDGHLGFALDDPAVSRRHVALRWEAGRWWLHNLGRRSARLPTGTVVPGGDPVPLPRGYTAVFVEGSRGRSHLLELHVSAGEPVREVRADTETVRPRTWALSPDEHLAMVVLGQRYLRHEPHPQPLAWHEALDELLELQPDAGWTPKRLQHLVKRIRLRLSRAGVAGLVMEEVDGPLGNQLNHNLVRELVDSTTLVAPDLAELER